MSTPITGTSTNPIRNIVVGVVTTVLGTAAVYYLGFHKSSAGFDEVRGATMNAWNSYVSAENTFFRDKNSILKNYSQENFDDFRKGMINEMEIYKTAVNKTLESRNIDANLYAFLKERANSIDIWTKKYQVYLDNYYNILEAKASDMNEKLTNETNRFSKETKSLNDVFDNQIDELSRSLTDKYGNYFSVDKLLLYKKDNTTAINNQSTVNRQMLVGKWKVVNDILYQNDDGNFSLIQNGTTYTGTWSVENNLLYHRYSNYTTQYIYRVTDQSNQSFTAENIDSTHYRFTANRINE